MSLHLGDFAPNVTAATTEGEIDVHEWQGDAWVEPGDRVIVSPGMGTEDARNEFDNVEEIEPYLRDADAPA